MSSIAGIAGIEPEIDGMDWEIGDIDCEMDGIDTDGGPLSGRGRGAGVPRSWEPQLSAAARGSCLPQPSCWALFCPPEEVSPYPPDPNRSAPGPPNSARSYPP